MTSVATLSRLFMGEKAHDKTIRLGINALLEELPNWSKEPASRVDMYYWYYGSYAVFQSGNPKWKKWDKAVLKALLAHQRHNYCEDGSWDPVGAWGIVGGRIYSTAMGALILEAVIRF